MMLHLCCRIVLVLGYFILRKWRNNAKKMELENANLKEERMTMQKKLENKMQIEKRQTLQMEETCKEQMQFGKRHI